MISCGRHMATQVQAPILHSAQRQHVGHQKKCFRIRSISSSILCMSLHKARCVTVCEYSAQQTPSTKLNLFGCCLANQLVPTIVGWGFSERDLNRMFQRDQERTHRVGVARHAASTRGSPRKSSDWWGCAVQWCILRAAISNAQQVRPRIRTTSTCIAA